MATANDTLPMPPVPPAPPGPPGPPDAPPPRARRWPRRLLIGVLVLAALLAGLFWALGRESTLQQLVQRLANASGGQVAVSGVSGSLYHRMHINRLVYKGKDSTITAEQIDINWSPLQYFSEGLAISELHVASLLVRSTGPGEPSRLPDSLAAPLRLSVSDARLGVLTLQSDTGVNVIRQLRFQLSGDQSGWVLRDASALTQLGRAQAALTVGAARPFPIQGTASLTQSAAPAGQEPAQLRLQAGGSLALLDLRAQGRAGKASGEARLALAPFDPIILRSIDLAGRDLNPAGYQQGWPSADLSLKLSAAIDASQRVSGQLALLNQGKAGPLDQHALPLQVFSGRLGGTLTDTLLDNVLLDLGPAGRFNGGGEVKRSGIEAGIDTARFQLRTERINLRAMHGAMNQTAIAGDITLASTASKQTLSAALAQAGLRLDLKATLENAVLQLEQARLQAKKGSISATGQARLQEQQPFEARLRADHFDPAALGSYPAADINAEVQASGQLAPEWRVASTFTLKPSKLAGQPLSGQGKLTADARHLSGVDVRLALAQNSAELRGSFGAPGEELRFTLDARQLSALSSDWMGAVSASGALGGSFEAPRARFQADARGLGLVSARRPAPDSLLHASGDISTAAGQAPQLKASGTAQRVNPAAFGASQAGNVGAEFTLEARLAADWRAGLDLRLQPSTLAGAPLSGHAQLGAGPGRIEGADIDLRLGANQLQASGSFGSARDRLDWKLDAPQLNAAGPQFGGTLRANGALSGSLDKPAVVLNLDGANLRLPGQQQIKTIRGSARLGNTAALSTGGIGVPVTSGASAGAARSGSTTAGAGAAGLGANAAAGGATLAGLAGTGVPARLSSPKAEAARRAEAARAAVPAQAGDSDVPLVSDIEITGYASPAIQLDRARLQTSGSRSGHTIELSAANPDFDAAVRVRGAWNNDSWTGAIDSLQNKGRYALTLQAPAPLRIAAPAGSGVAGLAKPEQIALGAAVIRLPSGSISLDYLEKSGTSLRSQGRAAGVPVSYLAQLSQAWRDNVRSDMTLGASWQLAMQAPGGGAAPAVDGMLRIQREQGDLVFIGADLAQPLGLRQLEARVDVSNGALRGQLTVDGARVGQLRLEGGAQLRDGRVADDSPLTISGSANMGSLAWLAPLAGQPGLDIDGTLKLNISGGGTVGAPQLNGDINGDKLVVNWADQGIKLRNGQLQARLSGDQLQLTRLAFDGNEGKAQADGWMRFANAEASMQLKLTATGLEVLARPDRLLVVSGSSTLVRDAKRFQLDGKFRADRANIELAGADSPTLSDDVVIVGKDKAPQKTAQGMPLNIDVEADLGDNFYLKGKGLDAQLAGAVRIRIQDRRPPRANGSIRVVSGTYAAYGQKLAIERGVINFSGAYDNPGLNILAVRKRPEGEALSETNVEAGVEVRGTALAPSAKLVSTPTVSDSDKLAWLVLGHGIDSAAGNDMALLGTAAGALFGGGQGKLASSLGLDELGVGQASNTSGASTTGSGQASGLQNTVVTVGKRLSARAYLSFEQGASTATSLVKLRYKLNPRITLQFQTGTNNALDVLYTWAFD
ncbi:translocation/assembly module TamB domain-containing protein [Oxalobacteraceae bacterium A2-2]